MGQGDSTDRPTLDRSHVLEKYVDQPDPEFRWDWVSSHAFPSGTACELSLTSQVWHDIHWDHRLWLYCPERPASHDLAMLRIRGGDGGDADVQEGIAFAQRLAAPYAVLYQIPNQPLLGGRMEDDLIAETFVNFFDTQDPTWPLLLPMVKAVVRAMDALQEVSSDAGPAPIGGFVPVGASKRGWTAWLTAAVDSRVRAVVPQVYDNLRLPAQMAHQVRTWGGYSDQIHDYTQRGIQDRMQTRQGGELVDIVDPFVHRHRLVLPKLIINGTNDRYWPLDALNLYWDRLRGPKCLLYLPNSGHSMTDSGRVDDTTVAFFRQVAEGHPLPRFQWRFERTDRELRLHMQGRGAAEQARLWSARSESLDFREARWESVPATGERGDFVAELPRPSAGYRAAFGEAVFAYRGRRFSLSTQVRIVSP